MGTEIPDFSTVIRESRFMAFAHRGANKLATENTLAAFQIAYDMGYRIMETDVQASKDGVLYCFHDTDLQRSAGDPRKFETLTSSEIDRVRLKGGHPIPKLAQLFEAFPNAYFNIDAKSWASVEPLIALTRSMKTGARTCFGSFSQRRIETIISALSQHSPARSLGTGGVIRFYLEHLLNHRGQINANCAQLPVSHFGIKLITPKTLTYAKVKGLKIHVWTINQAPEMQRLIDLGVDGIMSDDCAMLKSVLQKNGLWEMPNL